MPRLTDWLDSGISMFPNAAVAAICSATALLIGKRLRAWSAVLGLLIALIGGGTLFEHISGVNLGIDTLLVKHPWGVRAAAAPGRMGPPASTSFALLGLALMLSAGTGAGRRVVPVLGLAVSAIGMLSVTGYVFGADPLYSVARFTGIAMQTATILLALGLGVVASVPEREPARTVCGKSAAGLLARRALPFILGLPMALGWFRTWGQEAGWFDSGMGTALLVLAVIGTLCALLWWCAAAVAKHEKALRTREVDLAAAIANRTAELQETVNELETFSYAIVHDMRTPLRAMAIFAELLVEGASSLSSLAKEHAQRIVTGARRMDNLIRDSLDYTKALLQKFPVEPVDLTRLVRGLIDTYPNLHAGGAEVKLEGELPVVRGNESLLTQCFSNLLGNAVKFVSPGTRPRVRIWGEKTGTVARIWVEDNGIGIPREAQPRLFGMFQKLDNQYEGTGIGLAIVRKTVQRMRGKVGAESEPGKGSRFWVELPAEPQE